MTCLSSINNPVSPGTTANKDCEPQAASCQLLAIRPVFVSRMLILEEVVDLSLSCP